MEYYVMIVNSEVPRDVVAVGLGCWIDRWLMDKWSVTAASATERVAQIMSDNVIEIGMYAIGDVVTTPEAWPEPFWWSALAAYMNL